MTGNSTAANGSSNLEIAQSNQDLIMTKSKRKKRTWIIAGITCAIVLGLIIAAIVLVNKSSDRHRSPEKLSRISDAEALKLEDIILGRVNPRQFNATWVTEKELMYSDNGDLMIYDLEKKSSRILVNSSHQVLARAFEFQMSADRKFLLISHDYQKLYRHSYRAKHTVFNLETGASDILSVGYNQDLQLAVWSPAGNGLAVVSENNIFYKNNIATPEFQRLTNSDVFVTNGVPDWVYEEEVFSSNKALWFSPDGKNIAYGRFNDTSTPVMVVPIYGEPGNRNFQYPKANLVKYPKAGTPNPIVTLHVINLETFIDTNLEVPQDLSKTEPILSAVTWANNETVIAIWMNRVQNKADIVAYTPRNNNSETIINLYEPKGWLELFTAPIFSKDGSKMVLILSRDQGKDLGAFRHVVEIPVKQNSEITSLTEGAFVVTEIVDWNHEDNLIYYLANTENDSSVQHLYSLHEESKKVTCLSCEHTSSDNSTKCSYNTDVGFSKDFSYFVSACSGPGIPEVSVYTKANKKLIEWETNQHLRKNIKGKKLPIIEMLSIEIADGFKAQVSLKLPPGMDTSGSTKYPMLVNVYGGPDSFQVIDRFGIDWGSYLASSKGIIYATIDGRGSGLKGDKILFAGYRRLGTVEIIDQINVTKSIQNKLPFIDSTKTAIWGWSYGGYASGMALAEDKDGVFKCGVSVAPVTDWTLYDSIYTERFMGLPTIDDNWKGYLDSQLLRKFEGIRHKQYFLIHGTYDDNVHYQQSMMWAKVLEENDILFRQLTYPDQDHGLSHVRPHLYHSLESFFDECFEIKSN